MSTVARAFVTCAIVAHLCGCHPVPSVIGRSARVLARDEVDLSYGGGLWSYEGVNEATAEEGTFSAAYFTWVATRGLGHGADIRVGANNTQVFFDARVQFGNRDGDPNTHACAELGGSAWLSLASVAVPSRELHIGLAASYETPGSGVRQYVATRLHYGARAYWAAGAVEVEHSEQLSYFYGIERDVEGREWARVAFELFVTEPGTQLGSDQQIQERTAGINVIFGGCRF